MANAPDLAAWFARIGHTGPTSPTLQTLKALIRLHTASIPFENLSPLLGEPVLLDVNAWPSFALFRDEAAARIASHLLLRFTDAIR